MGDNAAEAHPCGFKWVIEAKIENRAKVIVVDPRFTRTASVADVYAPIRPGTDIAFLSGLIRFLLERGAIQREYVRAHTNCRPDRARRLWLSRTACSPATTRRHRSYDKSSWHYERRRAGLRQGRRHLATSALRDQPAAQACRPLHARDGVAHLRHAAGQIPRDLRTDRHHRGARQGPDQPVRAGMDAAFGRFRRTSAPWRWSSSCSATSAWRAAA